MEKEVMNLSDVAIERRIYTVRGEQVMINEEILKGVSQSVIPPGNNTYDQLSFHTARAIGALRFVGAYEV